MNYKIIFSLLCLILCLSVYASDDKFIEALKTCSSYHDSGTIQVEGMNATSVKQITGWHNNKCTYKESLNLGQVNANITCHFTRPQINEIATVADAYFLTLKYSKDSVNTSSLETAQNNPLAAVFNKYLQDSSVCTIDGLMQ